MNIALYGKEKVHGFAMQKKERFIDRDQLNGDYFLLIQNLIVILC